MEELITRFRREKICKLHPQEARLMCECAKSVRGIIIEVGRYKGGSMVLMSLASPFSSVYSIDCETRYDKFAQTLCGRHRATNCSPITGWSSDIAKNWEQPIDMFFLDGNHNEEHVLEDLQMWVPFVRKGGIILMHDYYPKVKEKRGHWKCGVKDALKIFVEEYQNLKGNELCKRKRIKIMGSIWKSKGGCQRSRLSGKSAFPLGGKEYEASARYLTV